MWKDNSRSGERVTCSAELATPAGDEDEEEEELEEGDDDGGAGGVVLVVVVVVVVVDVDVEEEEEEAAARDGEEGADALVRRLHEAVRCLSVRSSVRMEVRPGASLPIRSRTCCPVRRSITRTLLPRDWL